VITTQKELRKQFWQQHPELTGRMRTRCVSYGDTKTFPTDTRCAFVDWLDQLHRNNEVASDLASRATL